MSSELKSYIVEYDSISKEIKRLSGIILELKRKKKKIDEKIVRKLDEKEEKGVKYKNELYLVNKKPGRKRKTKLERKSECELVLRKNGITNAERVFKELDEAMKGHKVEKSTLKKNAKKLK